MDAVMREERVMGQLVGHIWKECLDFLLAELLFPEPLARDVDHGSPHRGVEGIGVEADEDHAVIEVDGSRIMLQLDKSIAKKYSSPEELRKHDASKSHVIQAQIIHQTGNLATFEVEYYFAKNLGERANLVAKTFSRGKMTEFWSHTYTPLEHGRNITSITVAMNAKAPERYVSDQLIFEILWHKQKKSGTTGAYVMEFIKQWER